MNKFYEIRGNAYRLEEDGRLVDPINYRYFRADQVEDVVSYKTSREINDIEMWCEASAEKLRKAIAHREEYLKYADGPAYYQDKERIRDDREELERIERYIVENF